ncbi:hypothetical protein AQUCO_01400117v1, partial [Aquilegia coerulea]
QVRFTKEIFKDYQEYLNRVNLYRQRLWTCKITGKSNLTYEEALVSEQLATERVQQFPKELVASVLHMVQFSTLKLIDLVNGICKKLQERLSEGDQLYGKKEQSVCPCKILKVHEVADKVLYEVGWINKDKIIIDKSVVKAEDLIRKKLPFGRDVLKAFIRESTSQSFPWIVHKNLAKQYGISTKLPEELRQKVLTRGSNLRIKNKDTVEEEGCTKKRKKTNFEGSAGTKKVKEEEEAEPIKYPIDDLLVQPGADDPVFTDRPTPSRDFSVPMDCVGDLLMVWDFCSSYSRMLQLWPFSLEDFQNAICHKDNNLVLIVESHSAILRLLIKEEGEYFTAIEKKSRSGKITLVTWTNYICDFLEMADVPQLSTYVATIKRGHYGLLDTHVKLGIFQELVSQALVTDAFRVQLGTYIEQRQELSSTRREVALEEGRKRREGKELRKAASGSKVSNGGTLQVPENQYDNIQNGHISMERDEEAHLSARKNVSKNRKSKSLKDSFCGSEDKDGANEADAKKNKDYLEREIEKRFVRTNPLGKDKNYNRYWFFARDGRIFVESPDSKLWGYYSSTEELDALLGSLNPKGVREKALHRQLKKSYDSISSGLQKRTKFIAHKIAMDEAVVRRSTRVRAPQRDSPALAFLSYDNKWKNR